jgi:hypothetical protein
VGNNGRLKSAARQHGSLVAVIAVALVGVMIYASVTTETLAASPSIPPASEAESGAPGESIAGVPTDPGGVVSAPGPFVPGRVGSGDAPSVPVDPSIAGEESDVPAPAPDGALPPSETSAVPDLDDVPLPSLPPGALNPFQQLVDFFCVTAFTPFGLPDTVFGLLGGGIPITLPNVPFQILIEPISDLCVALQSLTTQ